MGPITNMEIAHAIIAQLGGQRRLKLMTGASNFCALPVTDKHSGGLRFSLPSKLACHQINRVQVLLNGRDLYDVTVQRVRKVAGKAEIRCVDVGYDGDVHVESLQASIERMTGLVLTPPRIVGLPAAAAARYAQAVAG